MSKLPILTEANIKKFIDEEFIDEHGTGALVQFCDENDTDFEFCRPVALKGAKILIEYLREKLGPTDLTLDHLLLNISEVVDEELEEYLDDM